MHIAALKVSNFRRLKNVLIDLAADVSILVGSNNSGKTSAAHALQVFLGSKERISVHDFNSSTWAEMNRFGQAKGEDAAVLPVMSLDIWFHVDEQDLHRVIDLLPSLEWTGSQVGVRIRFAPKEESQTKARFLEVLQKAQAHKRLDETTGAVLFHPKPKDMYEFLSDKLSEEYSFQYFVLDPTKFDAVTYEQAADYIPSLMTPEKGRSGKEVLNSLLKVNVLNAQRHLSDKSGNRAEDLSRHLGRYYGNRLAKLEQDYAAMAALSESESLLNVHLEKVFGSLLSQLGELGYPERPKLIVRSALTPEALMGASDEGTRVHYVLNPGEDVPITLPDRYNGLGFKNLIYMVVQLLDLQQEWLDIKEDRPPLHVLFIEEPEVHLHAQLQQVFINKVTQIVNIPKDEKGSCHNQFLITTHSPHVLYERGFLPIRYFRRSPADQIHQSCEVLNLSKFYNDQPTDRDFLQRYMKLTHCDLFFSDAAVLVEGNVERLLMSQMIEKSAKRLQTACLSILEVGGAFAHRFRSLIEFLGIATLVITDIDSVQGPIAAVAVDNVAPPTDDATSPAEDDEINDDDVDASGAACPASTPNAVTSNQTLISWLPGRTSIAALLDAPLAECIQAPGASPAHIRVAYQRRIEASWGSASENVVGRTLEEAFALENLAWTQEIAQKQLKLRIPKGAEKTLEEMATALHKRVNGKHFKKTDFALALLSCEPKAWNVPHYIAEGLRWLQDEIKPTASSPDELEEVPTLVLQVHEAGPAQDREV